jgi:hypothetical protein
MFAGLSKTTIAHYVISIIFGFMMAFTVFYPIMQEVPDKRELTFDTGWVTYKSVSRKGRKPGLKTESGTDYFTCREFGFSYHDCIPRKKYQKISGKPGRIWWYKQPIFPGLTQKKVVYMEVSGKEYVNREMVKEDNKSTKNWWLWAMPMIFALAFYMIVKDAKRIKSKKYYAFK